VCFILKLQLSESFGRNGEERGVAFALRLQQASDHLMCCRRPSLFALEMRWVSLRSLDTVTRTVHGKVFLSEPKL
jgi:hypothetical protein